MRCCRVATVAVLALMTQVRAAAGEPTPLQVWQEFVADLKAGKITAETLRPYHEDLREANFKYLTILRQKADWSELQSTPEVHRVGDHLHFLLPLTLDGGKTTYCFTFVDQGGKWFYQHLESIFIRLDRTAPPPVSVFPDVSDEQKAFMREEMRVHEQVSVFNLLSQEKGKTFAFEWFHDGAGYFLAARAWVPFVPPPRAFILYACWEQANLRGNKVTMEALSDNQARIRMDLNYFRLYQQSGDLYQKITFADYRRLFETIWQDRARNADWDLDLSCKGAECVFDFRRLAVSQGK